MEFGLLRNKQGELYAPGVGNSMVWNKIYDVTMQHPGLKQTEIADLVGCSQGLVSKVCTIQTH